MSNTEKISAYLENEMSAEDKLQFEQDLAINPELRSEFDLQSDIIDGVKNVRRLELKSLLNNVAVGGAGVSGMLTFGKIATSIAIIGMVSLGIYYFGGEEQIKPTSEVKEQPTITVPDELAADNQTSEKEVIKSEEVPSEPQPKSAEPSTKSSTSSNKEPEGSKEVEIKRPSAAPLFETTESDSLEAPTDVIVDKVDGNMASLDVEIDNTRKKFSFHYQFNRGKLFLYGDFDKNLYEILEFKTRSEKTVFLYYQEKFYALDQKQNQITELKPVRESSLIEKLRKVANINQE